MDGNIFIFILRFISRSIFLEKKHLETIQKIPSNPQIYSLEMEIKTLGPLPPPPAQTPPHFKVILVFAFVFLWHLALQRAFLWPKGSIFPRVVTMLHGLRKPPPKRGPKIDFPLFYSLSPCQGHFYSLTEANWGFWNRPKLGNGPNTVSGSTVSNTELSEFSGRSLSSGERTQ